MSELKPEQMKHNHLVCEDCGAESRPGYEVPSTTEPHCPEGWAHSWELEEDD